MLQKITFFHDTVVLKISMRKFSDHVYNRIIERGEIMITDTKPSEKELDTNATPTIPAFGYELIREELLPNILGKEASFILYWAGKDLARKHPLESMDEIFEFFSKAGWGVLSIKRESKQELEVELTSPLIAERLKKRDNCSFQIEAGFLAQQIEHHKKVIAEAYEHPKKRAGKVIFTIKWDKKDSIE